MATQHGRIAFARANRYDERWEAVLGRRCRLYRPAPTTYLTPIASIADIGTQPALEPVEIVAASGGRVRIRRGDGLELAWPQAHGLVWFASVERVWATRPEPGLPVVLVPLTEEGRRVRVVWPEGAAAPDEEPPPGA